MPQTVVRTQWPDKALFASMLLLIAGILGAAFVGVTQVAHVDPARIPDALRQMPWFAVLSLSLLCTGLAVMALQTQRMLFGWLAAATAVASVGVFGLASVLGLAAAGFLLVALVEGEDKAPRLSHRVWPDKALAASVLLAVASLLAIWQGIAIIAQRMDPLVMPNAPIVMGGIDIALGLVAAIGATHAFKVRAPRFVMLGALAAAASLAGYVIGPAFGIAAIVLVTLAHREDEWT